jgi:hypothetical protein
MAWLHNSQCGSITLRAVCNPNLYSIEGDFEKTCQWLASMGVALPLVLALAHGLG